MKTIIFLILVVSLITGCSKEYFKSDTSDINNFRSQSSIQRDLLWLSTSLCLAHEQLWDTLGNGDIVNPISKLILENCRWGVSDYYAISYEKILDEAEAISIELDEIMNVIIRDMYNVTSTSNIVRNILANNYHNDHYFQFHLVIPYLGMVAGEELNSNTGSLLISNDKVYNLSKQKPNFSWIYQNDGDYPIPGFHANLDDLVPHEISQNLAQSSLLFLSVFDYLPSNLYFNSDYVIIDDCYVLERFCQECPYVNSDEALDYIPAGGGAMDHELQVNLISSDCFLTNNGSLSYAVLKALPASCYYYGITDGADSKSAYRVDLPLFSAVSGKYGNYLTLCEGESLFKVWGELLGGANYSLASGGVYSLSIPGVTADPVYFAFPFGPNIWFSNGPDMELHYDLDMDGETMCGLNDAFYAVNSSKYTYHVNEFFANNIVDPSDNRYIASTNLTELLNFWTDNWVHVGFSTSGYAMITPDNLHDFEAISPSTPTVPADLGEEIADLTKTVAAGINYYKIESTFFDELTYEGDEELILFVYATFENGEQINEYRYVTLDELAFGAEVSEIHTFFRGKIVDYEVKVFTKI